MPSGTLPAKHTVSLHQLTLMIQNTVKIALALDLDFFVCSTSHNSPRMVRREQPL